MRTLKLVSILSLTFISSQVLAVPQNTVNSPHVPLSHCYHWINESGNNFLTHKYQYAQANNGDITFYTNSATSNGAVAGPGLYCAKAPTGSYGYGDRVIRLDLVDDIVMYDEKTGRKYCGHDGNYYPNQATCDAKPWDIKFYHGGGAGSIAWYVIRNPQAIAKWSANSKQVEADLILNKKTGDYSFQMHADQTIKAMVAERKRMGELTIINNKARMNLLDILKDPKEVAKIPPLSLVARVIKYPNSDLDQKAKNKIYKEQIARALKDIYLSYSDFDAIVKMEAKIKPILANESEKLLKQANLKKNNVIVALLAINNFSKNTLSPNDINIAWQAIFKSDNVFASLNNHQITNKSIISSFFNNLPAMSEFNKIKNQNQFEILKMLNTFVTSSSDSNRVKPYVKAIINNYMTSSPQYILGLYSKKINNQLLNINSLTKELIGEKARANFKGIDPIAVGNVLDIIKKSLSATEFTQYSNQLKSLPLALDGVATYKLLGDYNNDKFTLPSFISKQEYFTLLAERSISERAQTGKNATNTFRLILSAFYEHFIKEFRSAKDDNAKDAVRSEAEAVFLNLALTLPKDLAYSYKYAAFQNAAYFSLDRLRYDGHPTIAYYKAYKSGDANFDATMEELTSMALDGSYIHYLIFNGLIKDEDKAKDLLTIIFDTLTSDDYDKHRKTNEFAIADKEKSDWRNFIYNRHIQNAGRNRTHSDLCGIAIVLDKFDSKVSAFVSKTQKGKLDLLIKEATNNGCKLDD